MERIGDMLEEKVVEKGAVLQALPASQKSPSLRVRKATDTVRCRSAVTMVMVEEKQWILEHSPIFQAEMTNSGEIAYQISNADTSDSS